jgi:hypothetical protein
LVFRRRQQRHSSGALAHGSAEGDLRVLPTYTDSTGAGSGLNHPNIEMSQGLLRASGFFPTGAPQNLLSAAGLDLEWPKFQA